MSNYERRKISSVLFFNDVQIVVYPLKLFDQVSHDKLLDILRWSHARVPFWWHDRWMFGEGGDGGDSGGGDNGGMRAW